MEHTEATTTNEGYIEPTKFALDIAERQYFHKDVHGAPLEDHKGMLNRVAYHIACAEAIDAYKDDHGEYPEWYTSFEGRREYLTVPEKLDRWIDENGYTEIVDEWYEEFKALLFGRKAIGAGRILAGAASRYGQLMNCFVLDSQGEYIDAAKGDPDSIDGIYELAYQLAKVTQKGGGCGIFLGNLREAQAYVKGSGGKASGVVSWLRLLYATTLRLIKLEGVRRGAGMATLNIDHPDALDFLTAKDLDREALEGKIESFNISFLITDDFMNAVVRDDYHTFISSATGKPTVPNAVPGKYHYPGEEPTSLTGNPSDEATSTQIPLVYRVKNSGEILPVEDYADFKEAMVLPGEYMVKARWLWNEIAEHAWATGDPGVLYIDQINRYWPLKDMMGPIKATNPCWTGDTKVLTVQGPRTFEELAKEGRDVVVLSRSNSVNGSNELLTFNTMRSPRLTRANADILRVSLSNGKVLKCTPDHNLFLKNGMKVEAKDLSVGDELVTVGMYAGEAVDRNEETFIRNGDSGFIHDGGADWVYMDKWMGKYYPDLPEYESNKDITITVVSVEEQEEKEHVYNGTVDHFHRYFVMVDDTEAILSANCGEEPLAAGESCVLGPMILPTYVKGTLYDKDAAVFDMEEFKADVKTMVRFLDNVLTVNVHPLTVTMKTCDSLRRIGLGVLGDADMCIKAGVGYDTPEGMDLRTRVAEALRTASVEASEELGRTKGAFPKWSEAMDNGDPMPFARRRNVHVLSIAPTGTISMISDSSSGIEPIFALIMSRKVGDTYIPRLHPLFEDYIRKHRKDIDLDAEDQMVDHSVPDKIDASGTPTYKTVQVHKIIKDILENHGSIAGLDNWFTEGEQTLFVVAHDVDPKGHVEVQATWQRTLDVGTGGSGHPNHFKMPMTSISKTINMPTDTTVEQVKDIYLLGWQRGLKGITMYRDGSRADQVLRTDSEKKEQEEEPVVEIAEVTQAPQTPSVSRSTTKRGVTTNGENYKAEFRASSGRARKVYVYIGKNDLGEPVEIFVADKRGGSEVDVYATALGITISTALKFGVR